jgi:hypothetical protein
MFETESILARGAATAEVVEIAPARAGRAECEPLELSLIDAVLAACELSDDQSEVRDLVDAMVCRPDVRMVAEPAPPAWAVPLDRIGHTSA